MAQPTYFEHSCGFYHLVGYTGRCDDDASRFVAEELDEMHGEDQWNEVFPEEEPAGREYTVRRKNYDRMNALTPNKDLEGNLIEIGCRVRCFMLAYYDAGNDWFVGMNTTGNCSYVEGKILQFLEVQGESFYLVETDIEVAPVFERSYNTYRPKVGSQTRSLVSRAQIPVNGKVVKGVRVNEKGVFMADPEAVTWKTFSVVRI